MKVNIDKEKWKELIESEPDCGIFAMSPRIYAYSRLTQYALIDSVARTIMHLCAIEGDMTSEGEDRICWMTDRLERYLRRNNPNFETDAFMAKIERLENQQVTD